MATLPHHTPVPVTAEPSRYSSLFYAWRVARPADRAALGSLHEVWRQIRDVLVRVSDPGVAAAKLAWWRSELAAMVQGRPQHPATQALWAACGADADRIDMQALAHYIDGCERQLMQGRLLDEPALLQHAQATGAAPLRAVATLLQSPIATLSEDSGSDELGVGLRLVAIVSGLGADTRAGWVHIPISDLQQFDVKAGELVRPPNGLEETPRFRALMAHQAQRARDHLDRMPMRPLKRAAPRLAKSARVLDALARAQLDELARADYATLSQRIHLTPLRKAWIAWRA